MRRVDQKPRRRSLALIAASCCAVAAALSVAPGASAQQGSAGDQYKLDLPTPTGSDQGGQPGAGAKSPSGSSAGNLADTAGDDAGVVVGVLAAGLAGILGTGGLAAYRRRQMADQTE
jgi:hypothetical protein